MQNRQGYSQTNVDGQQVTRNYHSGGDNEQAGYSRDAIQEFQVVANRFDATQGRSAGMIVNAITKSGTNTFAGSFGAYFRHDSFNAKDSVADRVLPYENQQFSGTFGGPLITDRLHFFVAYEGERQPTTSVYANRGAVFSQFNRDLQFTNVQRKWLARVDFQASASTRLAFRGSGSLNRFVTGGGARSHPIAARWRDREGDELFWTLTSVIGGTSVNEIKGGVTDYLRSDYGAVNTWEGSREMPYNVVIDGGTPIFRFSGYTIGTTPLSLGMDTVTVRDDFTTSYEAGGRHDVKFGADYLRFHNVITWCLRCTGDVDLRARGFSATAAQMAQSFPNATWTDMSTWNNLSQFNDFARFVNHGITDTDHIYPVLRHVFAGWYQDDWQMTDSFTLNMGVRYDWDSNGHNEQLEWLPFKSGNEPRDRNNFAPRVGFNMRVNDGTVIRGGYGLYFAFAPNDGVQQTTGYRCFIGSDVCPRFENQVLPDGRADFIPNWFNSEPSLPSQLGGRWPTAQEAITSACDQNNSAAGCVFRSFGQEVNYDGRQTSYAHQASIGFQHQLAPLVSFEGNFLFTGGRGEERSTQGNLSYNPATGRNYRFQDISRRPMPGFGTVNFEYLAQESNYYGADLTLTKRYSDNWQASVSYTASWFYDVRPDRMEWYIGSDGLITRRSPGFALAKDLGGEYSLASTDQRGRLTANGIWDIGRGLQLSGIYFYGSGNRRQVEAGRDYGNEGRSSEERLRADGTIIERNGFQSEPIHRVDMRIQQRIPLGGSVGIDGMFEIFNLMNHKNFGSYTLDESNSNFGEPSTNSNIAYAPRVMQVGFRLTF